DDGAAVTLGSRDDLGVGRSVEADCRSVDCNRGRCSGANPPVSATTAYPREISRRRFERFILCEQRRVTERLVDVFRLEVRVTGQNLFACLAGGEQPEQTSHGKTQPPDAGFAGAYQRIDRYP